MLGVGGTHAWEGHGESEVGVECEAGLEESMPLGYGTVRNKAQRTSALGNQEVGMGGRGPGWRWLEGEEATNQGRPPRLAPQRLDPVVLGLAAPATRLSSWVILRTSCCRAASRQSCPFQWPDWPSAFQVILLCQVNVLEGFQGQEAPSCLPF